ncbi:MAG: site-2 protease family protein [Myxococcota bacterium]
MALVPLFIASLAVTMVAAWILRVPIMTFSVGLGPPVWRTTIRGVALQFSLVPLGGYLQHPGEHGLWEVPPIRRAMLLLSGPVVLVLIGAAMHPIQFDLAVVTIVLGLINLMPVASLSGGQSLLAMVEVFFGREIAEQIQIPFAILSLPILYGVVIYVLVVLIF